MLRASRSRQEAIGASPCVLVLLGFPYCCRFDFCKVPYRASAYVPFVNNTPILGCQYSHNQSLTHLRYWITSPFERERQGNNRVALAVGGLFASRVSFNIRWRVTRPKERLREEKEGRQQAKKKEKEESEETICYFLNGEILLLRRRFRFCETNVTTDVEPIEP